MQIRQLAVHYDAQADRLLLRIRAEDGSVLAAWLTRRLCLRLWPHWTGLVRHVATAHVHAETAQRATATAEAAAMLADAARERSLQQADFSQPFEAAGARQPLGAEPLLAHTVQLTALPGGRLLLAIRDATQRSMQLELDEALAHALHELMLAALRQAEWGLSIDDAAAEAASPRVLN
jgi:hypothetical protein